MRVINNKETGKVLKILKILMKIVPATRRDLEGFHDIKIVTGGVG